MAVKAIMEYIDASDCNMDEGSLRMDANISVRPKGSIELGTRTEIKNLNSFRALERSVAYEIERQIGLLSRVETVAQETRGWDEKGEVTFLQRRKEAEDDYRYFPDPDLVPVRIDEEWLSTLRKKQPELPLEKRERLVRDYQITAYDAGVLTATSATAAFYEETLASFQKDPGHLRPPFPYRERTASALRHGGLRWEWSRMDGATFLFGGRRGEGDESTASALWGHLRSRDTAATSNGKVRL